MVSARNSLTRNIGCCWEAIVELSHKEIVKHMARQGFAQTIHYKGKEGDIPNQHKEK